MQLSPMLELAFSHHGSDLDAPRAQNDCLSHKSHRDMPGLGAMEPTGHSSQVGDDSTAANDPSAHGSHALRSAFGTLPLSHMSHDAFPGAATAPSAHGVHDPVDAAWNLGLSLKVPAVHRTHVFFSNAIPSDGHGLRVPFRQLRVRQRSCTVYVEHSATEPAPSGDVPLRGHGKHSDAPSVLDAYVPGSHGVHAMLLLPFAIVPRRHARQALGWPSSDEKLPSGHGVHIVLAFNPTPPPNDPNGHGRHAALCDALPSSSP